MAKLKDLSNLISLINGDEARTNSAVMLARKAGLFTTGGRGLSAPNMQPSDLTNALLLSLSQAAPTKIVNFVNMLRNAELDFLSIDSCDGNGFEDIDLEKINKKEIYQNKDDYNNRFLPEFLNIYPSTLHKTLENIFNNMPICNRNFGDFDKIHLNEDRYGVFVHIEIYNDGNIAAGAFSGGQVSEPNSNDYAWKLTFSVRKNNPEHDFFANTKRVLHSSALQAFSRMAREGNHK